MRIIQIVNSLTNGDVITEDVINILKILQNCGCNTAVYANHIENSLLSDTVIPYEKYENSKKDIMIYHTTNVGTDAFSYEISKLLGRKIIRCHSFMSSGTLNRNSMNMKHTSGDNDFLSSVQACFEYILAPTEYSLNALRKSGYQKQNARVVPYIIENSAGFMKTSLQTMAQYADEYTNILYVNRFETCNRQKDMIDIFSCYKKKYNKKSRLILIGDVVNRDYYEKIKEHCIEMGLNVGDIIFSEDVQDSRVSAFYKVADILLFYDASEGVEQSWIRALHYHIPVITFQHNLMIEDSKECGVLLDTMEPYNVAEWIDRLNSDYQFRNNIVQEYTSRINKYSPKVVTDLLLIGLSDYIKSIVEQLPQQEYVSALNLLSKFDLATAGQVWGE